MGNIYDRKQSDVAIPMLEKMLKEAKGKKLSLTKTGVLDEESREVLDQLLDFIWPIGSYYETSDLVFDPNIEWVGDWILEKEGFVHIGSGELYPHMVSGGETEHLLTAQEIPVAAAEIEISEGDSPTTITSASVISANAHNNMQPYIAVRRWHRISGLPTSIRIEVLPDKTEYICGETIDITGIVVKAYLPDGSLYDADGYPQGVIPLNELEIEPEIADAYYSDGNGVEAKGILMIAYDVDTYGTNPRHSYSYYNGKPFSPELLADKEHGGIRGGYAVCPHLVLGSSYFVTIYNDETWIKPEDDDEAWPSDGWGDGGTYWVEPDGYTAIVGAFRTRSRWLRLAVRTNNQSIPTSTRAPWEAGDMQPMGSNKITVKWKRPGDKKELTDKFEITAT